MLNGGKTDTPQPGIYQSWGEFFKVFGGAVLTFAVVTVVTAGFLVLCVKGWPAVLHMADAINGF